MITETEEQRGIRLRRLSANYNGRLAIESREKEQQRCVVGMHICQMTLMSSGLSTPQTRTYMSLVILLAVA